MSSKQQTGNIPNKPDPFWPEGVEPRHLSNADKKNKAVDAAWKECGVAMVPNWRCDDCGSSVDRSVKDNRYCTKCYLKHVENTKLAQKTNENWMEQAEQLGLAIYERQPEETDNEWLVWITYRAHYPLKMPSWTALSQECDLSVASVTKAASRWNYRARLVAWARQTDDTMQEERIVAIEEMNRRQLTMAKTIQEKLGTAIDRLDPTLLRPGEIVNLFKVATELERRVTMATPEKVESTATEAKSVSKPKTKAEDLSEVLGILQSTGVLQNTGSKVVGVEQKTTILVKEDGNETTL